MPLATAAWSSVRLATMMRFLDSKQLSAGSGNSSHQFTHFRYELCPRTGILERTQCLPGNRRQCDPNLELCSPSGFVKKTARDVHPQSADAWRNPGNSRPVNSPSGFIDRERPEVTGLKTVLEEHITDHHVSDFSATTSSTPSSTTALAMSACFSHHARGNNRGKNRSEQQKTPEPPHCPVIPTKETSNQVVGGTGIAHCSFMRHLHAEHHGRHLGRCPRRHPNKNVWIYHACLSSDLSGALRFPIRERGSYLPGHTALHGQTRSAVT